MNTGMQAPATQLPAQLATQIATASAALQRVLSDGEPVLSPPSLDDRTAERCSSPMHLECLTRAFVEVERMRKLLESSAIDQPQLAASLSNYQVLLKQFKSELPRIRGWLLAERARLASRQTHSVGVENWLEMTRQTR